MVSKGRMMPRAGWCSRRTVSRQLQLGRRASSSRMCVLTRANSSVPGGRPCAAAAHASPSPPITIRTVSLTLAPYPSYKAATLVRRTTAFRGPPWPATVRLFDRTGQNQRLSASAFQEREQAAHLVERQRLAIEHNLDQGRSKRAEHRTVPLAQIVQVNLHRLGRGSQLPGLAAVALIGQQFRAGGRVDAGAQFDAAAGEPYRQAHVEAAVTGIRSVGV